MTPAASTSDRSDLRARFDDEMRRKVVPPAGLRRERRGPLTWMVGPTADPLDHIVVHSQLGAQDAEGVVASEVSRARAQGWGFSWSLYAHDEPGSLREILATHGLHAGSEQTVLTLPSGAPALGATPPPEVAIRRIRSPDDAEGVLAVQEAVWGPSATPWLRRWFAAGLGTPTLGLFVAEARGTAIGAAWTTLVAGRTFAGLYGGTVLPEWRRRGIYRALVAARASAARESGIPHLVCGANAHSAPRLERLGFEPIATAVDMTFRRPDALP
jgi:GNAT superfamily N-acetyltransferase